MAIRYTDYARLVGHELRAAIFIVTYDTDTNIIIVVQQRTRESYLTILQAFNPSTKAWFLTGEEYYYNRAR